MTAMVSPALLGAGGGGGGGGVAVPLDSNIALGGAASNINVAINTSAVTAMPDGGVSPYTYAWSKTSGDANWTILSPNAATTQFRRTGNGPGESETATFICTVTAANGATGVSSAVQATVTNYGDPGGFLP